MATRTKTEPEEPAEPEATPEPPRPMPTNVIAALSRIVAEVGGVEKLTQAQRRQRGLSVSDEAGVKYAYRGIDQITAAIQPLLGIYGVVIVPRRVAERDSLDIELGNPPKPWLHITMTIDWRIYGPGGVEDYIDAQTTGEGRDNSDKGVNKATTGAYKNLLLKLLSIGDPQDDPDQQRHDNDSVGGEDEAERVRREAEEDEAKAKRQARVDAVWEQITPDIGGTPRGALLQKSAKAHKAKLSAKSLWESDDAFLADVERILALSSDEAEIEASPPIEPAPAESTPEPTET